MSTHDRVEAMTVADLIVAMNAGRVQQIATPRDLHSHPANTFVARFIGTLPMNMIPAAALAGHVALPPGSTLGVRPEDITLAPDGLTARLAGVEYLGADQLAAFDIGPERAPARVLVRLPARTALPGEGCGLRWPDDARHLFDADGQRLTLSDPA